MTKRNEAKYKIDRRMGQNIWGRPKSPINRREYGPGQHGQRRKGNTSENLIALLESRLDAIVYRSKFAPTPFAARQLVNHGHVLVNGKRVNIPSYRCKPEDWVEVRERSRNMALILEAVGSPERDLPDYIELDAKHLSARFIRAPELAEVPYPVKMEPNLVVEYYAS